MTWPWIGVFRTNARQPEPPVESDRPVRESIPVGDGRLIRRAIPAHECKPPSLSGIRVGEGDIWICNCGQRYRVLSSSGGMIRCGAYLPTDVDADDEPEDG